MQVKNILLYHTADKKHNVSVYFDKGTFWLTQKALASLFGVNVPAISKHLRNIFDSNELDENSVISKMETTAEDGKNYQTRFYRLEAILAVGYRVNSVQATDFRIWATTTLNEFIIKGFVIDDDRLKQGKDLGQDYFDELLERVREIRSSERRFYQKITDLYALSTDYDKYSHQTKDFFAAKLCADYSVTVGGVTYGDWYLPSLHELKLLYLQQTVFGGFASGFYWSSTELDNIDAFFVNLNDGSYYPASKMLYSSNVRAVRSF